MSEPFLGEIRAVGFNFAPRGWAQCNGQLLSIAQNSALFSLLGTTYGGDGVQTFALPDLRGRAAVGVGTGPGLSPIVQGQDGGAQQVTLTSLNLPAHTHVATYAPAAGSTPLAVTVAVANTPAPSSDPTSNILAQSQIPSRSDPTVVNSYAPATTTPTVALGGVALTGTGQVTVTSTGGGQPFDNTSPYLGLIYMIALEGIFPSRP